MLLLTQTMVQKRKTGCSNTAFCQEANRRLHSNTVSIIIENFLPTRRQQYLLQNFQQSSMYRSFHSHVPSYLHDRPRSVIIHCLDRKTNSAKILAEHVHDIDSEKGVFEVEKTSGSKHRIDFGVSTSEEMPSCTCKDWLRHHIPCKQTLFLLSSPTDPLGNGTTSLKLTCRVRISPQTPRYSMTTFRHPLII